MKTPDDLADVLAHVAQQPIDAKRIKGLEIRPSLALFVPTASTTNTTGYVDLIASSLLVPWDGSTPAFRALCLAKHNAGSDLAMTLAIAIAGQDDGAAEGTYGTEFGDTAITATTTLSVIDTGWVTPVMPTLADTLAVTLRGKSANAVNAKTWQSFSVYIDWNRT